MSESNTPSPSSPSSHTKNDITLSVYSLYPKSNDPDSLLLLDSYHPDTTISSVTQHLNFVFDSFVIKQSEQTIEERLLPNSMEKTKIFTSLKNTNENLQKTLSSFIKMNEKDQIRELTIYLCPLPCTETPLKPQSLEEDIVTSGEEEELTEDEKDISSNKDVTEDEEQQPNKVQNQPPEPQVKVIWCSKCNKKFFPYKLPQKKALQICCSSCLGGINDPDTQLGRCIVMFQLQFIYTQIDEHYELYLGRMNSSFNSVKNSKKRKRFLTKAEFTNEVLSLKTKGQNLVQRAQKLLFQCHLCSEPKCLSLDSLDSLDSLVSCFVCHFSCCDEHYNKSTNVCHFCTKINTKTNNLSQVVAKNLREHNLLLLKFDQLFYCLNDLCSIKFRI